MNFLFLSLKVERLNLKILVLLCHSKAQAYFKSKSERNRALRFLKELINIICK